MQILMDLAYLTGQRQSDLLSIKRRDVKDGEGIYFEQNKTGKKLIVEMSDELQSVVNQARELDVKVTRLSSYLIHNRHGYAYKSSSIQTAWQRLMRKCIDDGVIKERFQFKDIRAKARSDGEDKRLLGHADPEKMARIYQRKPERVRPVK